MYMVMSPPSNPWIIGPIDLGYVPFYADDVLVWRQFFPTWDFWVHIFQRFEVEYKWKEIFHAKKSWREIWMTFPLSWKVYKANALPPALAGPSWEVNCLVCNFLFFEIVWHCKAVLNNILNNTNHMSVNPTPKKLWNP